MSTSNDAAGFDLLVAIRDRAESEAQALEREAERLVKVAAKMAHSAVALRMLHATSAAMTRTPPPLAVVRDEPVEDFVPRPGAVG